MLKRVSWSALALAIALGTPAAVAAQSIPSGSQTGVDQSSQPAARGEASRYDSEIQRKLQDKLDNDRFQNVKASVQGQVVTLEGTVRLFAHKEQAEGKARDIDHVEMVRNNIQVSGKEVSDQDLRETLGNKLRYDRIGQGITFNALTLDVNHGVVTVGGQVRDEPDKASALAIVETTPGVKEVHDNIEVLPTSIADDDLRVRLAQHIYSAPGLQKYATDPQAPIRIVVERGRVTLYGVVNSDADKTIAGMRAREVSGSFAVENQLVVANSKATENK
jgi:hyperosmotically inducible periplasmic protein